ncbi:helix-turn-helix domain-containing protein [Streptomyces sp. H10-C2]|uniref:TetR/AcrR family transcriptional regulator n=1 Tax=unclassified Streptomyces TaxID=2593676 RepID=UPI0024BB12D6|nr:MULTISPECIES: TetR/AcrR family transcriptional regulator [unclassified Streptomyces]MDJ0345815.1 helix-turn-helix domain-containing protein [Streptomyces sp. PH10-H1]MDJ0374705.1 helix-turn-helix domain-containing protein [Streptomyces sp. H10-C2]
MSDSDRSLCPKKRVLRRDAQRNRDALIAVARSAFAQDGIDAPLESIAKRAGVAIGTLYRHFPTRIDVIEAIFAEKLAEWLAAAERGAAAEDAWEGFAGYLEDMCALQAGDRGFNDLASMRLPSSPEVERMRLRISVLSCAILDRAQRAGVVRPDLTPEDLAFLIWSQARITQATREIAPRAWRRHLALLLDGFRAERAHPLPEPAMTPGQVAQAMGALGGSSGCPG